MSAERAREQLQLWLEVNGTTYAENWLAEALAAARAEGMAEAVRDMEPRILAARREGMSQAWAAAKLWVNAVLDTSKTIDDVRGALGAKREP